MKCLTIRVAACMAAVLYLAIVFASAKDDYITFGMTYSTSVLWGAFWGPRTICRAANWQCSLLPWGVAPDRWVFNMRPEIARDIETIKQEARK